MDLLYQSLDSLEDSTFKCLHIKRKHHKVPLHYHPEIEIMYNIEGIGSRVVGNSVQSYAEGDFVLVGSNTPHVWKSAPEHYEENDLRVECLVLFIPDQLPLFELQELHPVKRLLQDSKRGIQFPAAQVPTLSKKLKTIYRTHGMKRVMNVLGLLDYMASLKNTSYLSTPQLSAEHGQRDFDRLSQCIDFLLRNYDQKIKLQTLADLANMTPNSFCRYFKKRTTKSFSQYLAELRIGKAAQLLSQTEKNIDQIAFQSGFNSLSNFNEQFKRIKGQSPSAFRKRHAHVAQ